QTEYTYDRNQNIITLRNEASQHDDLQLGGTFEKNYTYDKYNRLLFAQGQWYGYDEVHNYNLKMNYNKTHGILGKDQDHYTSSANFTGYTVNSYKATYHYDDNSHPPAPKKVDYDNGVETI